MGSANALTGFVPRPPKPGLAVHVCCVLAALALASLAIGIAGERLGRLITLAGHSADTVPYEIVIGNDVLVVPANMIRFEQNRRNGVTSRLDLYLRWPQMDGYGDGARDAFNHAGDSRDIIFLSLETRRMVHDMSGRLQPIYRQIIEDDGRPGPGGLAVHDFRGDSGFSEEVLVIGDARNGSPFVARCLTGEAAAISLAPCERDIHLGRDLSLTYRFPAQIADRWRQLDSAVLSTVESFLRGDR